MTQCLEAMLQHGGQYDQSRLIVLYYYVLLAFLLGLRLRVSEKCENSGDRKMCPLNEHIQICCMAKMNPKTVKKYHLSSMR